MKTKTTFYFFAAMLLFACTAKQTGESTPHATEADAIKKAVDDAYSCISFKQGQQLNYADIKKHFIPQAQLINFIHDTMRVRTIDQFVAQYKGYIESYKVISFYEEEIKGTTEQFGKIAHRISTYKTYVNTMDSVVERGVNSFQLIKTTQGWKVSSIIWDVERQQLKIPYYYLTAAD